MSYKAEVFNVSIASPGDVPEEREIIRKEIHKWNAINAQSRKQVLLPIGWETHSAPETGAAPQSIINRQVMDKGDLLVGVFWTRLGTKTDDYPSGTVEEIERHIAAGKTAMLYFSEKDIPRGMIDPEQLASIDEFRASCQRRSLYQTYTSPDDFRTKFSDQLQLIMNSDRFAPTPQVPEEAEAELLTTQLSDDAAYMLQEISKDAHGIIMIATTLNSQTIATNGHGFGNGMNPREVAKWKSAFDELYNAGFLSMNSNTHYKITNAGYGMADKL